MMSTTHPLDELADRLEAGSVFARAEAELVLAATDLVRIGVLGDGARRRKNGPRVTWGRVLVLDGVSELVGGPGDAGEVRLTGPIPASIEVAIDRVRAGRACASGRLLTGFSLADLVDLAGHDHLVLAEVAQALHAEGLEAVAEAPVDRLGPVEQAVEVFRAVNHGGLATWRLTVDRAPLADRLELFERATYIQKELGVVRAFAPLPRQDPQDVPSTGYDDVRTIAVARLLCDNIERIQVDWPLYGPKLAQVALAYGADDVDGISPVDQSVLGPRRAPSEDVARQIRAAAGVPAERDGRFQIRG